MFATGTSWCPQPHGGDGLLERHQGAVIGTKAAWQGLCGQGGCHVDRRHCHYCCCRCCGCWCLHLLRHPSS